MYYYNSRQQRLYIRKYVVDYINILFFIFYLVNKVVCIFFFFVSIRLILIKMIQGE